MRCCPKRIITWRTKDRPLIQDVGKPLRGSSLTSPYTSAVRRWGSFLVCTLTYRLVSSVCLMISDLLGAAVRPQATGPRRLREAQRSTWQQRESVAAFVLPHCQDQHWLHQLQGNFVPEVYIYLNWNVSLSARRYYHSGFFVIWLKFSYCDQVFSIVLFISHRAQLNLLTISDYLNASSV